MSETSPAPKDSGASPPGPHAKANGASPVIRLLKGLLAGVVIAMVHNE